MPYPVAAVRGRSGVKKVFTPLDIVDLQLWLDGSDITTLYTDSAMTTPVTSDDDVVGAWKDKSGNGYHATQTVTANKPLYKTTVQNGLSIIRFDGNDRLTLGGGLPVSQTVAAVYRRTAAGDYRHQAFGGSQAWGYPATTNWIAYNNWLLAGGWRSGSAWNNLLWHISVWVLTTANAKVYLDSALDLTYTNTLVLGNVQAIGSYRSAGTNYLYGDIAELIVYETELSTEDRQSVETYLNNKWSIY